MKAVRAVTTDAGPILEFPGIKVCFLYTYCRSVDRHIIFLALYSIKIPSVPKKRVMCKTFGDKTFLWEM